MVENSQPTFCQRVWESIRLIGKKTWAFIQWVGPKTFGLLLAIGVVVLAVVFASIGFKDLQVGGLLGRLLGRKPSNGSKTIEVVNTVDPDRVDKDGKVIPIGVPDTKGDTQAVVVPIHEPGIFSDPNTVVFTPPGETKPTKVVLPDGVTNKDVDQVIVVRPTVLAVTVKDSSGVRASTVDDLLTKYGG